jgi:predicted HicB family RNase H-like nuclease
LSYEPREAKGHSPPPRVINKNNSMLTYKGYIGFFTFDEKTNLFQGKISNIHDLVTFQGYSLENTRHAFEDAVNDYIDWCHKYRKKPEKPFPLET